MYNVPYRILHHKTPKQTGVCDVETLDSRRCTDFILIERLLLKGCVVSKSQILGLTSVPTKEVTTSFFLTTSRFLDSVTGSRRTEPDTSSSVVTYWRFRVEILDPRVLRSVFVPTGVRVVSCRYELDSRQCRSRRRPLPYTMTFTLIQCKDPSW